MYGFQSLGELKQSVPEFDDIHVMTWRRFILEVFLKRAFVGILKENVAIVSVPVAAMKPYDAVRMFQIPPTSDFLSIIIFSLCREVSLEDKSVTVGMIRFLIYLVNGHLFWKQAKPSIGLTV